MINFFRKFRQNLLSVGKYGKYLKYAIGEILLVVIGILIALSINNWNEKHKQTEYQIAQLSNLSTEIVSMKEFLNTQIGYFELAKVGNQAILKVMESDNPMSISPDSINSLINSALDTDLVTSERLSLKTKVDFKLLPEESQSDLENHLLDWRHFAERIGADFQLIEDNREDDLQRAMINKGIPGWQVLFRNYDPPNFSINYQTLLQSREVYAILYYRLKRIEGIIGDLNDGIDNLDKMLSEIN